MKSRSRSPLSGFRPSDAWQPDATDDGSEPLIVGALGRCRPSTLRRMKRFGPFGWQIRERDLTILSSSPLPGWSSANERGLYWRRLDRSVSPEAQEQAWLEAGSAGIVANQDDLVLHSDPLGTWPVFYTKEGSTIYFSNRLAPVVAASSSPSLDAMAWASMLSSRSIPPGRSPVAEVATIKPGSALRYRRPTANTEWIVGPPLAASDSATVPELIEAIQLVLAAAVPITLALSGGYDSRFLLACGLAAGLDLEAVTADPDTGLRLDVEQARIVAMEAGVEWEEVSSVDEWFNHFAHAADRLDYLTTFHPWFVPAATHLRRERRCVVFGLGGGITLNDHLQITPIGVPRAEETQARLLDRLGLGSLAPTSQSGIAMGLRDLAGDLRHEMASMLTIAGHDDAWQARSILALRTGRSIAAIATRLTGPEVRVCLPYMAPRVFRCTLSPGIHSRRSDTFYQELMKATHPGLAAVPTTKALMDSAPPMRPRRQTSRSGLQSLVDLLLTDEVAAGTLDPELSDKLRNPDELALGHNRYQAALHGAASLALFRRRFPEVGPGALGELAQRTAR